MAGILAGQRSKLWAKREKSPQLSKAQPLEKQTIKNGGLENSSRHKGSRMSEKMHKQAFSPLQMHEQ